MKTSIVKSSENVDLSTNIKFKDMLILAKVVIVILLLTFSLFFQAFGQDSFTTKTNNPFLKIEDKVHTLNVEAWYHNGVVYVNWAILSNDKKTYKNCIIVSKIKPDYVDVSSSVNNNEYKNIGLLRCGTDPSKFEHTQPLNGNFAGNINYRVKLSNEDGTVSETNIIPLQINTIIEEKKDPIELSDQFLTNVVYKK